jgi:hypothetical protein
VRGGAIGQVHFFYPESLRNPSIALMMCVMATVNNLMMIGRPWRWSVSYGRNAVDFPRGEGMNSCATGGAFVLADPAPKPSTWSGPRRTDVSAAITHGGARTVTYAPQIFECRSTLAGTKQLFDRCIPLLRRGASALSVSSWPFCHVHKPNHAK